MGSWFRAMGGRYLDQQQSWSTVDPNDANKINLLLRNSKSCIQSQIA